MENNLHYLHYLHQKPRFACLCMVTCIDIHLCASERRLKIWRRLLKISHVRFFQKSAPNLQKRPPRKMNKYPGFRLQVSGVQCKQCK